ncbi:unnamed protein product [Rotaria sp. Silwood2]|nr:unnamed protein product [Rotaria sp. Silwood2]CAF2806332.1 unnamed protein product [Rotaria sp. Silwood2]CAF3076200.1 unnamed protein product [Rotaria sp. Silwood2]CAF4386258.1 unnamed protein product [Rotaria sp. Silwood2]CAF4440443.1 unnamed protein product [Rotaria sp. Silwood2]
MIYYKIRIVNIFLIISFCSATPADSSCSFEHPTKSIINLASVGLRNGQSHYRDLSSPSGSYYTYSFNPCYPFVESHCYNAAVCQIDNTSNTSYTIGLHEYAYLVNMNGTKNPISWSVYLSPHNNRHLYVQLICNRSMSSHCLQVLGEMSIDEYVMKLSSPYACRDGCVKSTPPPGSFNWHF